MANSKFWKAQQNFILRSFFVTLTGVLSQTPYYELFLIKLGFGAPTMESLPCPTRAHTPSQQHQLTHPLASLLDPEG